ncbi:MAG TPA: sigma-70 family RNA polymerase sigma factor [Vicinamibacterales bacterium]|nr:sigma-70 family RNA polymerase sigma factor [Vicinamibacterales bacterium]
MTTDKERQAAALMASAQDGNQAAYAELLALLTGVARAFVRARIGALPWTDDVVQETLLTVHLARHTYDPARPFAPWFYAILRSRFVDAARKHKRVATREVGADVLPDRTPADRAAPDDDIDVARVRASLAALPERQREVIVGLKYRDESVREVAARLGLSESAVKVTAHRGYKAMRRWLGGRRDAD